MMNLWNLGSKESVGITYKDGISTELWLKLWFEKDWYLVLKATAQKQSSK